MLFTVKTWNNGARHASGAGYGLKITLADREEYFNRNWQTVILQLEGYAHPIEVNVGKASFWSRTCGELISKHIGIWLQQNDRQQWPNRQPHQLRMTVIGDRAFLVEFVD